MSHKRLIPTISALAALAFAAGCQHQPPQDKVHGEEFIPQGQVRSVDEFTRAQAARGARADATLVPAHFDGDTLNTLGQQKLDLMLHDGQAADPLVVYLDVPQGTADARRRSIVAYLADRGLNESQVRLESGPNPNSRSSAADAQASLKAIQPEPQAVQPATSAGNPQPSFTSH